MEAFLIGPFDRVIALCCIHDYANIQNILKYIPENGFNVAGISFLTEKPNMLHILVLLFPKPRTMMVAVAFHSAVY